MKGRVSQSLMTPQKMKKLRDKHESYGQVADDNVIKTRINIEVQTVWRILRALLYRKSVRTTASTMIK